MPDLLLSPTILDTLAKAQTAAAPDAQAAASALSGLGRKCWVSHGVISGMSNSAISSIESTRQATGSALAQASVQLAAKLEAAQKAYQSVDEELAGNLNKQMLDK
jgi:Excreted virulence factor EspC, type VII ESX diderm